MDTCKNCGGSIIGDGITLALHCENADIEMDREPDAPVKLCERELETARLNRGMK